MATPRGWFATLLILTGVGLLTQCGFEDSDRQLTESWAAPPRLHSSSHSLRQGSIRINELHYDDKGKDLSCFTELIGPAGASLDSLRLVGINGEDGRVYAQIDLSGQVIGADGLFVIAQVQIPEADLVAQRVNWHNGPDRVELRNGDAVMDGLTYGDPTGSALSNDGDAILQAKGGASLGRCPAGSGTGSVFVAQSATPGSANACEGLDEDTGQLWADAPSCAPLYGLTGKTLRAKLLSLVANHNAVGYIRARTLMYSQLDLRQGKLECVYSGRQVMTNGRMPTPTEMNCEHTWPQSWGAVGEAKSDLHHLFPVSPVVNSTRNNSAYGWVREPDWEEGGSKIGLDDAGKRVLEVRMKQRGNSARAMFYFAVRYDGEIDHPLEAVLKTWNRQDPPDDEERTRNEAISEIQANRNPFVDCPSLVDQISDF